MPPPPFATWTESLSTQTDRIWVKTAFGRRPNFGQENLSEDLFFVFTLFWAGKRTDSEWKNFSFGLHYSQISKILRTLLITALNRVLLIITITTS